MFKEGKEQTIVEVLAHRDRRVQIQKSCLKEAPVVITVALNIPGPIKNNSSLSQLVQVANQSVRMALPQLKKKAVLCDGAGYDYFYTSSLPSEEVKRCLVEIEETHPLGRLFDLDVQVKDEEGKLYSLSRQDLGYPPRRCLICAHEAKYCARSRAHSIVSLQAKIEDLWAEYIHIRVQKYAQELASEAVKALCYEAVCHPKPGLVDPVDCGSHQDMDIFTLLDSATSLYPYFSRMFCLGVQKGNEDAYTCFLALRQLGQAAEQVMFEVTHQVNTHKGAIFSFALILCALGRGLWRKKSTLSRKELQSEIQDLSRGLDEDFKLLRNKEVLSFGEKLYMQEKIAGIRGEAQTGFAVVFEHSLPFYQAQTGSLQERLLNTLLWIPLFLTDTTLIKRSHNAHIMKEVRPQLQKFFILGGAQTTVGQDYLQELNTSFKAQNWSLGGSADCLALTIFLDYLEQHRYLQL